MSNWKRKVAVTYLASLLVALILMLLALLAIPIYFAWLDFGWKTLFLPALVFIVIGGIVIWEWSNKQL